MKALLKAFTENIPFKWPYVDTSFRNFAISNTRSNKMDCRDFPLATKTRRQILAGIFDCKHDSIAISDLLPSCESYFAYYNKSLEGCRMNSLIRSHGDIANTLAQVRRNDAPRTSIEELLRKRLDDSIEVDEAEEILDDTIDLAFRLLLMVPTGGFSAASRSITLSGGTKVNWKTGTMKELVFREFSIQSNMKDPVKLERIFNARNLERIAGVEVRWTSNLADHLRMRDDDKAVEIFHYATFLKLHQDG